MAWLKIIKKLISSSDSRTHNLIIASTASYCCATGKTMIFGVHMRYNNDGHFAIERGGSNYRWNGTSPPTIVGVRKLQCLGYLTVKTAIASNAAAL